MNPYVAVAALTMTSLAPSVSFITWDADTPIQIDTYFVTTNYPMTFGVVGNVMVQTSPEGAIYGRLLVDGRPWPGSAMLHCGSLVTYEVSGTTGRPEPARISVDVSGNGIRCPDATTP